MTVIATDGYTVACDSYSTSTDGTVFNRNTKKIFRIGKEVVGVTGKLDSCLAYIAWLKGGEKPIIAPDEGFVALHVSTKGAYEVTNSNFSKLKVKLPHAIGSGADLAIGSMLAGAYPEKAVRLAYKHNCRLGGRVQVEDVY